jgi:plasmid stabilization system protein ParE
MAYTVVVTENAKDNLRAAYRRAAEHAPETAARWLCRFEIALESLSINPERCSLAPENDAVEKEIRQFFFGKRGRVYRVLFTIEQERVMVLDIRWGGMDLAGEVELFD